MPPKISLVLSPAQLELFARIDPNLPALITQAGMIERTQEYRYAVTALVCGFFAFVVLDHFHGYCSAFVFAFLSVIPVGNLLFARCQSSTPSVKMI